MHFFFFFFFFFTQHRSQHAHMFSINIDHSFLVAMKRKRQSDNEMIPEEMTDATFNIASGNCKVHDLNTGTMIRHLASFRHRNQNSLRSSWDHDRGHDLGTKILFLRINILVSLHFIGLGLVLSENLLIEIFQRNKGGKNAVKYIYQEGRLILESFFRSCFNRKSQFIWVH